MAASKLRKVGQDFKLAGTPFDRWGAGESEVSLRGIERRYVLLALDGVDTQKEAWPEECNGDAQRVPLPRCGVLHRTSCVRHKYPL